MNDNEMPLDSIEYTKKLCPFGRCSIGVQDNVILFDSSPFGCECSKMDGRKPRHYEGLSKPRWNVKPVGRHGGKIQAAKRKHEKFAEDWRSRLDWASDGW